MGCWDWFRLCFHSFSLQDGPSLFLFTTGFANTELLWKCLRVRSHWALSNSGAKNLEYPFLAMTTNTNAIAIANSSVWTEPKVYSYCTKANAKPKLSFILATNQYEQQSEFHEKLSGSDLISVFAFVFAQRRLTLTDASVIPLFWHCTCTTSPSFIIFPAPQQQLDVFRADATDNNLSNFLINFEHLLNLSTEHNLSSTTP